MLAVLNAGQEATGIRAGKSVVVMDSSGLAVLDRFDFAWTANPCRARSST